MSAPEKLAKAGQATPASIMALVDQGAALNDEEAALLDQVKRMVANEIAPRADGYDRSAEFPWANVEAINALGLSAMMLPEDCGGVPLSYAAYLACLREISRGCASTGLIWATNFHATNPIVDSATAEQRQRLLPVIAEGGLAAVAITEASGGSDATAMRTSFTPDGDDIVINGEIIYITNGDVADLLLVFGKWTPLGRGKESISAVVIEKGAPGFQVLRCEDKLGHRASSTAALAFENLRVPRANLIGEPGSGLAMLLGGLNKSRPSVAAHCLGMAQAAFDDLISYGQTRQIRGRPLLDYQANQFKLAELAAELVACNALLWRVAHLPDQQAPEFGILSGMLKLKASELALAMSEAALQLHGGAGYCREFRAERLLRDARLGPVGEGASEVLRELIGRSLAGVSRGSSPREAGKS